MTPIVPLALTHMVALMSPGPDFALILKQGIVNGRRAGVLSAAGIACGITVHVILAFLGLSIILAKSPTAFMAIQLLGASYLVWMGAQSLKNPIQKLKAAPVNGTGNGEAGATKGAFRQGLITNLLNPKAAIYFISVFGQLIHAENNTLESIAIALFIPVSTLAWFMFLAKIVSSGRVRTMLTRNQGRIELLAGVFFFSVGVMLVFKSLSSYGLFT